MSDDAPHPTPPQPEPVSDVVAAVATLRDADAPERQLAALVLLMQAGKPYSYSVIRDMQDLARAVLSRHQ